MLSYDPFVRFSLSLGLKSLILSMSRMKAVGVTVATGSPFTSSFSISEEMSYFLALKMAREEEDLDCDAETFNSTKSVPKHDTTIRRQKREMAMETTVLRMHPLYCRQKE